MSNGSYTQIKCIIVDDEPMARDVIRRYVDKISRKRPEVSIIFLFEKY
jgi:hypothetical protein